MAAMILSWILGFKKSSDDLQGHDHQIDFKEKQSI
jgi:hypothetical protein